MEETGASTTLHWLTIPSLLLHKLLQINRRETVFSRPKMLMLINNVKWPKLYPDLTVKILLPGRLTVGSHPSPFMYGSAWQPHSQSTDHNKNNSNNNYSNNNSLLPQVLRILYMYINSCNPMRHVLALSSSSSRQGNWGTGRLFNFPRIKKGIM